MTLLVSFMEVSIDMNTTAKELLTETMRRIDGAYSPSTIRAYKANFERFIEFCESIQASSIPANSKDIATYIALLSKSRLKSASIRIAIAAISSIHKLNQFNDPTQHPDVAIEMRRMHRTLGRASKQAYGITEDVLEKMISTTKNDLRGLRDRALLHLAYISLCRRTELVSLRMEDIVSDDRNFPTQIRLRRSKTDQEAIGKVIRISAKAQASLKDWIDGANISEGFIFRGIKNNSHKSESLSPGQINRIYKRMAILAKIPKDQVKNISGHSTRVGAAQDLINSGASLPTLMKRGRWTKPDTAIRYAGGTGL